MVLQQRFLTQTPCYRANQSRADSRYAAFQDRGPRGLMLHSVGCAQPSAAVFCRLWDKSTYTNACVHAFIDADTGVVWQTLPWTWRGWHCAGSGNNTHLGVEMCESGAIRYLKGTANSFELLDPARARADCRRTYAAAVELFARLCAQLQLDPLAPGVILSHREGHAAGIASNHGDPEHYWRGLQMGYTMDGFRADVARAMKGEIDMTPQELTALLDQREQELTQRLRAEWSQSLAQAAAQVNLGQELTRSALLGPYIRTLADVPHDTVRSEVRQLLDSGAINGGTDAAVDPDDIYLPYNVLRAVVMAKRYADRAGANPG